MDTRAHESDTDVRREMGRLAGWLLGLATFGGLIVLSVAGVNAALAILITGSAIVGMIAMGNLLGGRTTPNRPPHRPDTE